ncbi:MAG: PLDc N-terminal domain-containing protein [Planctomycetes bacterium]|nr:PLDc N-terminal domain-containing protein [Planctomycetota bacterium]
MVLQWILAHCVLMAGIVVTILVITHIIHQKGSPSHSLAWLVLVVFAPYIGVPLYLILAPRKMRRAAARKHSLSLHDADALPAAEAMVTDRLLCAYGMPGATSRNRLTLCQTGEEAYARLVELIENARESIHIAVFILSPDEVGHDIVERLARRAAEGIEVRLLLDDIGSLHTGRRFLEPLKSAGGRYAYFMPILHLPFRGQTNLRNHRKIIVTDGGTVMAGGANIAAEYIGPTPMPGRWRDLAFTISGPAAEYYENVFLSDWEFAAKESLPPRQAPHRLPKTSDNDRSHSKNAVLQVIPSGPDVNGDPLYDAIVTAAFAAKHRFWIVTPYFIPDPALDKALALGVLRGIDVRIIVPKKGNHLLTNMACAPYLRSLQESGATIHLYTPTMLHAKIVLADDSLAIVGSANMDMRSFFLNYEVATFIYSGPEIRAVKAWIETLLPDCITGVESASFIRETSENLVRVIAPIL